MPIDAARRPGRLPGLAGAAVALSTLTAPALAATVEVTVSGIVPNEGSVRVSLCESGLDRATCSRGQTRPADSAVLAFLFPDVVPGRYAAVAFQDVEGDGVLPRSRMGRPLAPYGLSNGAGRSRRPTFEQAAVRVGAAGARIAIRLERPGPP